ncbi:hypothetical protein PRIPAC_97649, partial [Pristionchus pacificus]|uniref:Serpentine receptor class gamma n=1 Tax=Pristionchus pacificus TaxID=54126 RepID=A0A2A6D207_PRIPA
MIIFPDIALVIYATYIPFFIALYALEVVALIKYWRGSFNSSFFKIFILLAVVNIAACIFGSFVFRFNLYPIINNFYSSLKVRSGWLTAAYSGAYYLNCLSEFLGVLLACNRFTALFCPIAHDRIWMNVCYASIILCVLVAIAPVWFLFDDPTGFMQLRADNFTYYVVVAYSNTRGTSIWLNMVIVTVTCNALSTLLYSACLVRLCTFSNMRLRTAERNLFLVGFISMLFSLPYMILMLPWLTDLKYLTPAPMLILTNHSIRRTIRRLFSSSKCE